MAHHITFHSQPFLKIEHPHVTTPLSDPYRIPPPFQPGKPWRWKWYPGTARKRMDFGTKRYPCPFNRTACAQYRLRRTTHAHARDTSVRLLRASNRLSKTVRNAILNNTFLYYSFARPDAILRRCSAILDKISSAAHLFPTFNLSSLPHIRPLGLAPNGVAFPMSRSNVEDVPMDLG